MDHKILVTVFQCIPVSGYWNKDIPSKCIDDNRFFIGSSIANILTDLALLLLPTRYIWRLHRTTSQKLALAITFMLGGLYATTLPSTERRCDSSNRQPALPSSRLFALPFFTNLMSRPSIWSTNSSNSSVGVLRRATWQSLLV